MQFQAPPDPELLDTKELVLSQPDLIQRARFALARGEPIQLELSGHSMVPTILAGEAILIEPIPPDQVAIGDIVLYRSLSDTAVIHRVRRIEDDGYLGRIITRGDAARLDDFPVSLERVLGYAVAVEREGEWWPLLTTEPVRHWANLFSRKKSQDRDGP